MLTLPTILYRAGGPFPGPVVDGVGTTYETHDAETADELAALKAKGWCETLPEAVTPAVSPRDAARVLTGPITGHLPAAGPPAYVEDVEAIPDRTGFDWADLHLMSLDDLKAIAKDLPGYDGRLGKDKLIALIEKARG